MTGRANLQLAHYLGLYVSDQKLGHGDSNDRRRQVLACPSPDSL
jgi:hypothetical protein